MALGLRGEILLSCKLVVENTNIWDSKTKDEKFAYLSREEKKSIHQILETTLEAY